MRSLGMKSRKSVWGSIFQFAWQKSLSPSSNSLKDKGFSTKTAVSPLSNKFPYKVYFIVDDSNLSIIVFAILHEKRDPQIWQKRSDELD